jgi:CrcB protein
MGMILSIAAGGAVGAVLRYLTIIGAHSFFGAAYPIGTLIVNVLGSLIMGLLVTYFAVQDVMQSELRSFWVIGVLGAFTTFSAFSFGFLNLWEKGDFILAFAYGAASVILSVLAVFVGVMVMRHIMA